MKTESAAALTAGEADRFATTCWSVVLHAHLSATEQGSVALSKLCRSYWRPIFAFICRRGYSPADAQDLTQDFFLMVIEGNLLKLADPNRGRFRSLLLKSLQNFLIDQTIRRRADKRGGRFDFVSWDDWMVEAPSQLKIPLRFVENLSPEKIFDVRWAATIVEHALARLREECEARGRRRLFDLVSVHLTADRTDVCYSTLAQKLGVKEAQVKGLLHRMRLRYRDLLRDEVAQTVESPGEIDEEIRYLCAALSAAGTA